MPRAKGSVPSHRRRKEILSKTKGYYSARRKHLRAAKEQLMHSGAYAFRDRRARKGEFRRLWIVRINAAARAHGLSYNRFINGLRLAEIELDRKVLAELAVNDPDAFAALAATAKSSLEKAS